MAVAPDAEQRAFDDLRPRDLAMFLVATFGLAWMAWGLAHPGVQRGLGVQLPSGLLVAAGTAVPSAVALIIAARRGRARALLSGLLRWRVGWGWYAVAVLGPPALMAAAMGGHLLLGGTAPDYPARERWPLVLVNFAAVLLVGGPLGEELGWRGLAVPVLRRTMGLAPAGLLSGGIWAVWHLPLFLVPGTPQAGLQPLLFMLQVVAMGVILAEVHERTGRSLLLPVLLHASANSFAGPLRMLPEAAGEVGPFAIATALAWLAAGLLLLCAPGTARGTEGRA